MRSDRLKKKRERQEEKQDTLNFAKRQKKSKSTNPFTRRHKAYFTVREHKESKDDLQRLFDQGVRFNAEEFEDDDFLTTISIRSLFQKFKLKTGQVHTHFPLERNCSAKVMQRLFSVYLLAENAKELEWQKKMLQFLQKNRVGNGKRDMQIAECLESFIAFSDHIADMDILKTIIEICAGFNQKEINNFRIVIEAFESRQLRNEGFIFALGVLWRKCRNALDDEDFSYKYFDPKDTSCFHGKMNIQARISILITKCTSTTKKDLGTFFVQFLVVLAGLVPKPDEFLEELQGSNHKIRRAFARNQV